MKHITIAAFFAFTTIITGGNCLASEEKVGVVSKHPSASPDGTEVVFTADFDGPMRLWISHLDGSKLRKISTNSVADGEPAWSPDARKIAFASTDGVVTDIWTVNLDGSNLVKLTSNGAKNRHPAWSPDGKKIAFVSNMAGSNDIWIMNADGTQQSKVVSLSGQENRPSFSPTGDKIVFSETADNAATLMIANVDGTNVRSLTTGKFHDWDPNWGANGISFSSNRDTTSSHWKIWAINPDGSGLRKVNDVVGLDPVWMRDGRILFSDASVTSRALTAASVLNPQNGTKRVIAMVEGYLTAIDIRPGKNPSRINPMSNGKVEVAILSSGSFDVTKVVDQSTITFGRTGNERSLVQCNKKFKDVNNDGLLDLRCRFTLRYTDFQPGDTIGIARFLGTNGVPYEGREPIILVSDEDSDDFKEDN